MNEAPRDGDAEAARPRRLSLRAKGAIAFVALLVFVGGSYAYIEHERGGTLRSVAALERLHRSEEALTRASLALSDVVFHIYRISSLAPDDFSGVAGELGAAVELLASAFTPAAEDYPLLQRRIRLLLEAAGRFGAEASRAGLLEVREALGAVTRDLDREVSAARERRRAINEDLRRDYERISAIAIATSFVGLLAFGIAIHLFFRRLTLDLEALRSRAQEIVGGARGNPLRLARRDELGELARAVDRMSVDLAEREARMTLALRQESHQERMAALGAMAANFAHEIGNPVATVSALAQEIRSRAAADPEMAAQAGLIVEQCERIAQMTRRVADLARPPAGAPTPMDLNGLTRTVCDFLRFDPRLRRPRFQLELDAALPAAFGTPDHVVQVLMDVLVAAIERVPEGALRGPLAVRTGQDAKGLYVRIAPDLDANAADAAFADEARIALARHLARSMRGDLEISRSPQPVLTLWLRQATTEGG